MRCMLQKYTFQRQQEEENKDSFIYSIAACISYNKEQKFSSIVPVFQSPLQDTQNRLGTEGSSGVSHCKVANSLPGPASTPRSKKRERGKGNKHTLHTLPSQ